MRLKNLHITALTALTSLNPNSLAAEATNIKNTNNYCIVLVKNSTFSSFFPLNNFTNFIVNKYKNPQYSWMTEVGDYSNDKFHPFEYAYSFGIPLVNENTSHSIDEISKIGFSSLHLSNLSLNKKIKMKLNSEDS